ncbi:hypothetical protein [Burkholderia thailandensis]|uniref:hypothetical protein n=1 Tax=Burkholderia thailandensis TaxID=57975 RepID=UPI00165241F4|nr:hypothetical protein [Burkholderia thailandensis]
MMQAQRVRALHATLARNNGSDGIRWHRRILTNDRHGQTLGTPVATGRRTHEPIVNRFVMRGRSAERMIARSPNGPRDLRQNRNGRPIRFGNRAIEKPDSPPIDRRCACSTSPPFRSRRHRCNMPHACPHARRRTPMPRPENGAARIRGACDNAAV